MHSKSVSLCIIFFISLMLVFTVSVHAQRTSVPTQVVKTSAGDSRTVTFINKCDQDIYWGVVSSSKDTKIDCGSGYFGHPGNGGGLITKNGGTATVAVNLETACKGNKTWSGNFYARTGCKFQGETGTCDTGSCGNQLHCKQGVGGAPPATRAEFKFDKDGNDFYDISNVDGFNVGITIKPTSIVQGTPPAAAYWCTAAGCTFDFIKDASSCPAELQVKVGTKLVGCDSACQKFDAGKKDAMANSFYCCTGQYSGPSGRSDCGNCCHMKEPSGRGKYSKYFKDKCGDAYAWPQDDNKSTFSCVSKSYEVVFCPK